VVTRHNRERVQKRVQKRVQQHTQHHQPNGRFIVDIILVAAFIAVLLWLLFFVLQP
jgi:hypothetical protein